MQEEVKKKERDASKRGKRAQQLVTMIKNILSVQGYCKSAISE